MQKVLQKINSNKLTLNLIKENTTVSFDISSKLISISAITKDKGLSNKIVQQYSDVLKTELEEVYDVKSYIVIQETSEATSALNINHKKDLITAGISGLIISGLYVVIVYLKKNTINAELIEENFEIRVIGKFKREKKSKKVIDYFMHDTSNLNTLNKMAITIQKASKNRRIKSILVTGAGDGAGSTHIVTNLANTYAKLGYSVLVIDANKNGIQDKIFNRTLAEGFSDLILRMQNTNIESINMNEYISTTPIVGVSVMVYGEEKISEKMLISERSMQIFNQIANQFDIVIVDAPNIKKDIFTIILATFTDYFILVTETEKTKLNDIKEVKESLKNIDSKINGIVLNKIDA